MAKPRTVRNGIDYGDIKPYAMNKKDHSDFIDIAASNASNRFATPEDTDDMVEVANNTSSLDNPEAFLRMASHDQDSYEPALVDRPIKELNEMFGDTKDGIRITQSDIDKMGSSRLPSNNVESPLEKINGASPVLYRKHMFSDTKPVAPKDKGPDPRRRPQV
jgi:hypothetical protein